MDQLDSLPRQRSPTQLVNRVVSGRDFELFLRLLAKEHSYYPRRDPPT